MWILGVSALSVLAVQNATPASGLPNIETCLSGPTAGWEETCRQLLETEIALAPNALFNGRAETPPDRLEGWLGVTCAGEQRRLDQSVEACREDAEARVQRSRAARRALAGYPVADSLQGPGNGEPAARSDQRSITEEDWGFDLSSPVSTPAAGGTHQSRDSAGPAASPDRNSAQARCRRENSNWQNGEGEQSGSHSSVTCSWGDQEDDTSASQEALETLRQHNIP